jgi:demethylmenaquinone methyltransferase / 2-methoxy-6-polyprenyl-1,4-benzoquinol methylase
VNPTQFDVVPPSKDKARVVREMFGAIAGRYDLLNHLLSLNRDRVWRRRAVTLLLGGADGGPVEGRYLDGCAGTLDLALELAHRRGFRGDVIAFDFALPMLRRGLPKLRGGAVRPVCADGLRLPFRTASFDGATVGFGVRNLADLDAGLAELGRVLRPGARLVVLEFTVPAWRPFRWLYLLYFRRVLPWIGKLVSRHGQAYSYLPASVLAFPEPAQLAQRMHAAGFRDVSWETYFGGIVATHVGTRVP